jgi:GNAT superfamily N-acetyltransferase
MTAFELRAAEESDREVLLRIYASTRTQELAQVPWNETQKQEFLRFQFEAQHQHYHHHYPNAEYAVILRAGVPAGRLYLDRRADEHRLVDIALLPEYRGAGVGTALLTDLIGKARGANKPLRIHVEEFSPALRLYARLGFRPLSMNGLYILMECR